MHRALGRDLPARTRRDGGAGLRAHCAAPALRLVRRASRRRRAPSTPIVRRGAVQRPHRRRPADPRRADRRRRLRLPAAGAAACRPAGPRHPLHGQLRLRSATRVWSAGRTRARRRAPCTTRCRCFATRSLVELLVVDVGPPPTDGSDGMLARSRVGLARSHRIGAAHREIELAEVRRRACCSRAPATSRRPHRLRRLRPLAPARMGARRRHPPPARAHDRADAALALSRWTSSSC